MQSLDGCEVASRDCRAAHAARNDVHLLSCDTSRQRGYILLPVVLLVTLVAAVAWMLSSESALEGDITNNVSQAAEVRYVAEAGLNHTLAQITQVGCGTYTDTSSMPFGNNSYSSTITTNNIGGTLTSITVPVTDDSWIDQTDGSANHGTDIKTQLGGSLFGGNYTRPLYRFDIENAGIAPGATVVSAVARFYVITFNHASSVYLFRVTDAWDEASVTWDSISSSLDLSAVGSIPAGTPAGQYVDVNITGLVQSWLNGAQPNYGLTLAPSITNGSEISDYATKDHSNAVIHPHLIVQVSDGSISDRATVAVTGTLADGASRTISRNDVVLYQQPPAIHQLQPDAAEGEDAEIWQQAPNTNYGNASETWVSSASSDTTRTLLRFDLDKVPVGAKIIEATLSLYRQSGSGADQPVSAHRITNSWREDEVTWNEREAGTSWDTPGVDFDGVPVSTTPVGPVNQRYEWNIMSLAQGWVNGNHPNYGVVLVAAVPGMAGERFNTSDHATTSRWPRLSITYTCECGTVCIAPQGSGNILLVVGDAIALAEADERKQALFADWGYTVNLISDDALQADYDTALAANDVAYISETVWGPTLGNKLASTDKGVVNEEYYQVDNLGLASSGSNAVGDSLTVTDNSHYITALFPNGVLPISMAPMESTLVSGTPAPSLQTLGEFTGTASLALVDGGGTTHTGGTAAGRRVNIPVGHADKFNWDYLNNNGRLIVQRAIQWGTGNTGGSCTVGNFRDEFTVTAFSNNDGSLAWAGDWIEADSAGSGPAAGKALITGGELRLNGTPAAFVADPSVAREMDLSNHLSATLTFDYRTGSGVEPGEDSVVVEISGNGGTGWTVLEDFINEPASASGSRSYDISDYLAADTQVRFRINVAYGGPSEYFYVDNLDIAAGCSPPPPPVYDLLLVVGNSGSLSAKDAGYKALMESWGYTVTLIDDGDSQANFNTAMSAADVVYVSGSTSGPSLLDKVTNTTTGVVNEINGKLDNFGFSSSTSATENFDTFSTTDATHYITSSFGGDPVTVFTSSLSNPVPDGTLAPDLQTAGEVAGAPALVALDAGATGWDGNPVPARRAHLPFTVAETSDLTSDGITIMQRTIEWAAGADTGGATLPIAHWKLDETSGTTAMDSAGGHHGTLTNGPAWAAGAIDGGLSFDGSNDYITVPHDANLTFTGELTFTAWGNTLDTSGGYKAILAKDTPGNGASNYWFGIDNDELVFGFWAAGSFRTVTTPGSNLQPGTWYHLAASFDNATDAVRLYVDGTEVQVGAITQEPTVETADLWIGHSPDGEYWNGMLDDVRIYDTVLDSSEISDLAAAGGGGGGGGGGGSPTVVEVRVATGNDDAEERISNGSVNLTSTDLELISDGSNAQLVGLRFTGVAVPNGATISSAWIQFQVDETNTGDTTVSIQGEATDSALQFQNSSNNISSRNRTTAQVPWTPVPWTTVGEAGADQRTPDLGSVIQEIVARPGWASGNDMVLIITGSGERTAESYNGSASGAPLLHIEY